MQALVTSSCLCYGEYVNLTTCICNSTAVVVVVVVVVVVFAVVVTIVVAAIVDFAAQRRFIFGVKAAY